MEKLTIENVRGDSYSITVMISDENDNEIIVGENGQVYFTLKDGYENDSKVLIRKKIGDGIRYVDNVGYVIDLDTNDTNELDYGRYVFDIEYKVGNFVKTFAQGTFKLTKEVTHKGDEY